MAKKGPTFNNTGDIIGFNTVGNNNVIGKDINFLKTNTEISQVTIDQNIISKLDKKYAITFIQLVESLNKEIKKLQEITSDKVVQIQNSLEDLAKETQGLTPGELPSDEKKKRWKVRFKIFAKYAIGVLPRTGASIALFSPFTAQFSQQIEEGLQFVVEAIQAGMGP